MDDKSDVPLGCVIRTAGAVSIRSLLGNEPFVTGAVFDLEREGPVSSGATPIVNAVNDFSILKPREDWSSDASGFAPFTSRPRIPDTAESEGGGSGTQFGEGL